MPPATNPNPIEKILLGHHHMMMKLAALSSLVLTVVGFLQNAILGFGVFTGLVTFLGFFVWTSGVLLIILGLGLYSFGLELDFSASRICGVFGIVFGFTQVYSGFLISQSPDEQILETVGNLQFGTLTPDNNYLLLFLLVTAFFVFIRMGQLMKIKMALVVAVLLCLPAALRTFPSLYSSIVGFITLEIALAALGLYLFKLVPFKLEPVKEEKEIKKKKKKRQKN